MSVFDRLKEILNKHVEITEFRLITTVEPNWKRKYLIKIYRKLLQENYDKSFEKM